MRKSLFFLLFVLSFSLLRAQTSDSCSKYRPLPHMFIDEENTLNTSNNFISKNSWIVGSKYKRLRDRDGSQDTSIFFTRNAVTKLLNTFKKIDVNYAGVRVYFAQNRSELNSKPFIDPLNYKVLMLFSCTDSSGKTINNSFYFLNDSDDSIYHINDDKAMKMDSNYYNYVLAKLTVTLLKKDSDNVNKDRNYDITDTWSILYRRDYLDEAINTEYNYEDSLHQIKITGYNAMYAAYPKTGNDSSRYKKRLFIFFEYTKDSSGNNVVMNLSDTTSFPEFQCRYQNLQKELAGENLKRIGLAPSLNNFKNITECEKYLHGYIVEGSGTGVDNAKLCPPSSGCPTQ